VTTPTGAPAADLAPTVDGSVWHALSADQVLQAQRVDGRRGLSPAEVTARAQRFGPNAFDAGQVESRWHAFIRQYADPMQIVLLVAGVVSLYPLKELETGLVLIFLTLFNAVLGLRQEGKAAAAVAALQKMIIVKARVTRNGRLEEIAAAELVPGDVVSIEAGDVVPADGRLLQAATLEIAESALTRKACRSRRAPTRYKEPTPRSGTGPIWST
jgi:P-type Ca2+ transporter type 2C